MAAALVPASPEVDNRTTESDGESPLETVREQLDALVNGFDSLINDARRRLNIRPRLLPVVEDCRRSLSRLQRCERLPPHARPHGSVRVEVCRNDLAAIIVNLETAMTLNAISLPHPPDESPEEPPQPPQPLPPHEDDDMMEDLYSDLMATKYRAMFAVTHVRMALEYHSAVEELEVHRAAAKGELLHFYGALDAESVESRTSCGGTVLHAAVHGGDRCVVQGALQAGARLNPHDHFLHTPLMMAALMDDTAMVRFLLAKEAMPDVADERKHTPMFVAVARENKAMMSALKSYGAATLAQDALGLSAYELAVHFHRDPNMASIVS